MVNFILCRFLSQLPFFKIITFKTSDTKNKDITRKENYSPNSLINLDVKVLKELLANPATCKKNYTR